MRTDQDDHLNQLFADQKEIDRKLLADALADIVTFDRSTRSVRFRPGARDRLDKRATVLAVLLGQRALGLALGDDGPEGLAPKSIGEMTGIKSGTVRPLLHDLSTDGVIVKHDGMYRVPNSMIETAVNALSQKGGARE